MGALFRVDPGVVPVEVHRVRVDRDRLGQDHPDLHEIHLQDHLDGGTGQTEREAQANSARRRAARQRAGTGLGRYFHYVNR